ncbi:MAG: sigma factor-like helix-turn-helix DNA-binding protein [Gammaproteobacteria bacterium]
MIELTFVEGFSYPQIANIMGCPENTVKTRMFHARRRISSWKAHERTRRESGTDRSCGVI